MSAIQRDSDLTAVEATGKALTLGTTYHFPLGGESSIISSVHWQWDAAIVITSITIQSSNYPDVAVGSVNPGDWVTDTLAPTPVVLAAAGGAAGGGIQNVPNSGARRLRAVVVVGATGGVLRGRAHGKAP